MIGVNINGQMSKEEIAQKTSEAFKNIGVNLLATKKKTTAQTISNTTGWKRVSDLDAGVTTTGGLLIIHAHISYTQTVATGNLILRLRIDGADVQKRNAGGSSASIPITFFYAVKKPAGTYKVEIYAQHDAGTSQVLDESNLNIIEFLGAN